MEFVENLKYKESYMRLEDTLARKIVVLDGAMGTMIQQAGLEERDFRGERFASHDVPLKGCNDLLVITQPDVIRNIHMEYLESGARIIETDSFNANSFSLADYGLSDMAAEINVKAARLARGAADDFMASHPGEYCWVAGSMGPTGKSLTMSCTMDKDDSGVTWDSLAETYEVQAVALIEGGADILLIETVFDTLNAKAAIWSARRAMEKTGIRVPLIISVTMTEASRTLSGQTLEAFVATIAHASPLAVGLNCGFGANRMEKYVEALQPFPFGVAVYPNAGLPDEMGCYRESPEETAALLGDMMKSGMINIVGGCCGTTPRHIKAISEEAALYTPRIIPDVKNEMVLAGLEPLVVSRERNFVNVGERCNVAGSRKFLRLIKEQKIDEALAIAESQVEAGAQIVDINMDDGLLDAVSEMNTFISRAGTEPGIARVPFMIDSSDWKVIEEGLKRVQGRPIVNSISLKEGEEAFLSHARYIREMGAAVVVMAFDEKGQADTYERKIEVCKRAYRLLVDKVGFKGHDIVLDPNVLAVATGIDAHNNYGHDFIKTVTWIKQNLPGAKVSGGISNLSFSFRGNNKVREAMHSIFLYYAIKEGMDMGIVNAASMLTVDEVSPELRNCIEDVIFNRSETATDCLVSLAAKLKEESSTSGKEDNNGADENLNTSEKIERMLIKGVTDGIEDILEAALKEYGSALSIIDGPMMDAMNRIGTLFGEGKLFLPQVVKSARTMKLAVGWLTPFIEEEKKKGNSGSSGKMVIATVKGDVHDIGKNIVGVIMNCNGFDVIDLGVMVPSEEIVDTAIRENADFVGLSGLITPSLEEMCCVARMMEARGLTIPLFIGGATASAAHTAVRIAPCYSGPVIYTHDAASLPAVAMKLMNKAAREDVIAENLMTQKHLRDKASSSIRHLTLEEARSNKPELEAPLVQDVVPSCHDFVYSVKDVRKLINWRAFFAAWQLDASFASIADIEGCDHCRAQWLASQPRERMAKAVEASNLFKDASRVLDSLESELTGDNGIKARTVIAEASSDNDIIRLTDSHGVSISIPCLRQQHLEPGRDYTLSLADFVAPATDGMAIDRVGVFAVTSGQRLAEIIERYKNEGDDYRTILYQSVADRLVEAATELLHSNISKNIFGKDYMGIRPAVGYPSLPDQSLVFELDRLADYSDMGIKLTERGAMIPSATTTGLIIVRPEARYFIVGEIDESQRSEYASRRGLSPEKLSAFLPG